MAYRYVILHAHSSQGIEVEADDITVKDGTLTVTKGDEVLGEMNMDHVCGWLRADAVYMPITGRPFSADPDPGETFH